MKNLNDLKQKGNTFLRNAALLLALAGSITAFSQDIKVYPTNKDNTDTTGKVAWVNGGVTGFTGVTAPAVAGWIDTPKIVDNNLAGTDYAQHTSTITSGQVLGVTRTTTPVSVSNGQTYITTPFTGYYVGVNVSRAVSGSAVLNLLGTNEIIINTYLGATLVETSDLLNLNWAIAGSTDVGFYVHKPFDRVEVQLVSNAITTFTAGTLNQRIHNVYLQRYTRTGGGFDTAGDKVATCNAQIPLTGKGLTVSGQATVIIPIPPFIINVDAATWPGFAPNLEDEDPVNTHGTIPFISVGQAVYVARLKDEGVVYPKGTFGGGVYQLNAISGGINVTKTLRFYLNGVQQGLPITNQEFLSASAASSLLTVGAVSEYDFDAIEYEIALNLTASAGTLEVFYPIIQRFCDANITCGIPISLIAGEIAQGGLQNQPVYAKAIGTSVLTASLGDPGIKNVHNVIDPDITTNYAEIGAATGATLYSNYGISVISRQKFNPTDPDNSTNRGYADGTFAGFEIQDDSFATASAGKNFIISTYKAGTEVGRYSTTNVLAANLFTPNNGKYIIGFKSPAFDEVRLTVELIVGASAGSSTKVYRAVIEKFCQTSAQACNTVTNLKRPAYPVFIDAANTGVEGVATGNTYFEDLNNLVANTNSPAKLYTAIGGITNASVAVQDGSKAIGVPGDATYELYPAGTFAGFDVGFPTLLAGELLGSTITISTLNADGSVADSAVMNSSFFGLHTSILNGVDKRQILGFASKFPFTGVKLTVNKAVSASAGVLNIYSAVIERFCATPVIKCDEIENISVPKFPLYINGERTGVIDTFADGNSSVSLSQNAIDDDVLNPNTYATMQLGATAFSELGFSVANGFGDFPKDTYIGFDIASIDLLQANGFAGQAIELYKDGILVQNSTGTQLAAGVSSDIVAGGFNRIKIGTVAHQPFDEVRYVIKRALGASAGEIRIYNVVARDFSPTSTTTCPLVLQCDGTYVLTDGPTTTLSPRIPAVIEFANTGYEGVVSAGYGIENVWNAVSPLSTDYATIHFPASGITRGSISVAIPKVTLPAGTFAGFTVDKLNFPFSGGFLTNVKVTTYLNGQEQEHRNGGSLIDFSFFGQWVGTPANIYTPGFQTMLPFDEVQISIESGFSAGDQTLRVYSAYIRTVPSTTTTIPGGGTTTPIICINGACYKPAATGGTVLETKHGITALGRAGSDDNDNWPMVRKGAWTVLESKEKGFVINRVALTANLSSITNPIEGMMVYDEEVDCLKIYTIKDGDTTAAWHCFTTQACPD